MVTHTAIMMIKVASNQVYEIIFQISSFSSGGFYRENRGGGSYRGASRGAGGSSNYSPY